MEDHLRIVVYLDHLQLQYSCMITCGIAHVPLHYARARGVTARPDCLPAQWAPTDKRGRRLSQLCAVTPTTVFVMRIFPCMRIHEPA